MFVDVISQQQAARMYTSDGAFYLRKEEKKANEGNELTEA
jgi:hypothetical protein